MKYEEALKKLEEIARQIENGDLEIDALAARLKEARDLITLCKSRLTKAEEEVEKACNV